MSKSVETHFPIRFTQGGSIMVCPLCGGQQASVVGMAYYPNLSRLSFAGRCGHTFEVWFKTENGSTHLQVASHCQEGKEVAVG